jgi:serine phosphatase RsbU (regulator of sigma subunit)
MFPDVSFEPREILIKNEEMAVLFTDGIPEGRNKAQEEYTEERLRDLVLNHLNLPVSQLSEKILEDVRAFGVGTEQADDITLVIIKRRN